MGTVRTRITKKVGPVRTTTSWDGKRGVTNSISTGNGSGIGRTRVTWSTNQKTGKTRMTQSMKVGQNSWYITSKTSPSFRGRRTKGKGSLSPFVLGLVFVFFLILMVV